MKREYRQPAATIAIGDYVVLFLLPELVSARDHFGAF